MILQPYIGKVLGDRKRMAMKMDKVKRDKSILEKHLRKKNGFTLVEMIVVIVIILILSAVLVPNVLRYVNRAREASLIAECRNCVMITQTKAMELMLAGKNTDLNTMTDKIEEDAGVDGTVHHIEVDFETDVIHLSYTKGDLTVIFCARYNGACRDHDKLYTVVKGDGIGEGGSGGSGDAGDSGEGSGGTGDSGEGSGGSGDAGDSGEGSGGSGDAGDSGEGSGGSGDAGDSGEGSSGTGDAGDSGAGSGGSGDAGDSGEGSGGTGDAGGSGAGSGGTGVTVTLTDTVRTDHVITGQYIQESSYCQPNNRNDGSTNGSIEPGAVLTDGKDIYIKVDSNPNHSHFTKDTTFEELNVGNQFIKIESGTPIYTDDNIIDQGHGRQLDFNPRKGDLFYSGGKLYVAFSNVNKWCFPGESGVWVELKM